ncbi:hypothetical protein [Sulfitobacter sp. JB4-11]|uniref:hypothetical protein n=1 Tax=Sulfitobacter rhodophyticola TaxID=3238304 RepID=UPI003D8152BE
MKTSKIFLALGLGGFVALATAALSQEVPAGACMLPTGEWCWPIAPLSYGDPCECEMPDGTFVSGIVQ